MRRAVGARLRALVVAAAALAGVLALPPVAKAQPNYLHRGAVAVGFCWDRFTAFGTGYQIKVRLISDDRSAAHVGKWEVRSRTGSLVYTQSSTVTAGGPVNMPVATVSTYNAETFTFKLDGVVLTYDRLNSDGIRGYMNNCDVAPSSSAVINTALAAGVKQVGLHYVGGQSPCRLGDRNCDGGIYQWRHPSSDRSKDQKPYLSPLGLRGFDCSGLVYFMWKQAGVTLTRGGSSTSMLGYTPVGSDAAGATKAQMRPGDLIVKSGHVAIYIGDGDGNGVASVLEASPTQYNTTTKESANGVNIIAEGDKYFTGGRIRAGDGWVVRRIVNP